MRERIVRVAVAAVAIALLLFAVPLAVIVRSALFEDERRELQATALQGAVRIDPDFVHGDPVELPHNSDQQVGVYDVSSRLRFGLGPATGDARTPRKRSWRSCNSCATSFGPSGGFGATRSTDSGARLALIEPFPQQVTKSNAAGRAPRPLARLSMETRSNIPPIAGDGAPACSSCSWHSRDTKAGASGPRS